MSQRFKESKATTAKHAEQLRAMLKRPENKVCVDCKRNGEQAAVKKREERCKSQTDMNHLARAAHLPTLSPRAALLLVEHPR